MKYTPGMFYQNTIHHMQENVQLSKAPNGILIMTYIQTKMMLQSIFVHRLISSKIKCEYIVFLVQIRNPVSWTSDGNTWYLKIVYLTGPYITLMDALYHQRIMTHNVLWCYHGVHPALSSGDLLSFILWQRVIPRSIVVRLGGKELRAFRNKAWSNI